MIGIQWTVCIILVAGLLAVTMACPSDTCAVISSNETSIATQVIDKLKARRQNNDSFTFYIQPGRYNSTNGTQANFYYFSNITLQKNPKLSGEVIIQCPNITDVGDFNSLGFNHCTDISIIGLTFTECGQKSFASYYENVSNVNIIDSTFRRNRNNGLGIRSGTNISIINCTFERSVGLQNDSAEFLIQQVTNIYGGASLGIALQDTINTTITVENCTFRNNLALKSISYYENESRPYNYIPFGNGGGIYISLNSVANVRIRIANCHFYNNTALHQGGGIVAYMTASYGNTVEVVDSDFIGNKAIGYPLFDRIKKPISNYDEFIEEINSNFSTQNFDVSIRDALLHVTSETIIVTGGFGGALTVNFLRDCEFNNVLVKGSTFSKNLAIGAAGVGVFTRDAQSSSSNGVNSNRALISGYVNSQNYS